MHFDVKQNHLNNSPPSVEDSPRKLLVLDTSYSLEAIRERQLIHSVTCRDLNGFFRHVWTVHPFASLVTSPDWASRCGKPDTHELTRDHTFIEGKIGRYPGLQWAAPLNFLLSQLSLFVTLLRLIRREKISVIRVGDPLYLGLFGWALSRLSGIPFLVRLNGNHDKVYETTGHPLQRRIFFTRKIEKLVERFIFARTDLLAALNQDNLDFALANGARPAFSTLFRLGNLIDERHFAEPASRPDAGNLLSEMAVQPGRFLVCIGRLESVKHPDDVVHVLAQVRERGHDVKAIFVGDGQMRQALGALAERLGVQGEIIFCGNKDQGWLAQVVPHAAAVVSPITGRALTEAALAAAPVVAYDIDWQREMVETGVTGELVPHLAIKEMASAVVRFLDDRVYARAMGDAIRQRAMMMLDPELLNQHERDQYSLLLARDPKNAKNATAPKPVGSADD
jgi:glycosyltransferase involved in cell wall biosynthesis